VTVEHLADELASWADHADYSVIVDAGGSCQVASEPGGEIVYYLRVVDGLYAISQRQRNTPEDPYAWELSEADAVRFMIAELGDGVRDELELPPIWRSYDTNELPAGYQLEAGGPGQYRLSRDGVSRGWYQGNSMSNGAVAFAYISELTVDALRAIYLDPNGAETIPRPAHPA
jgi:hypothetical protein